MLQYTIEPFKLPTMVGKFRARVRMGVSIGQEKLLKYISDELGTTVTYSDTLAVFNTLLDGVRHYLLDGHPVNLDIFNVKVGIKGIFNDRVDSFDKSRHKVRLLISGGKEIKKYVERDMKLIKTFRPDPQPMISQIWDYKTKTTNLKLSISNGVGISGKDLNFDKSNNVEGLFLIDGGTEIKISNDDIYRLTSLGLMFLVPATVPPGTYTLEIRKNYGTELRKGIVENLTVA